MEKEPFNSQENLESLKAQAKEMLEQDPQYQYRKLRERIDELLSNTPHQRNDRTLEIIQEELINLGRLDDYYQHEKEGNPLTASPLIFESELPQLNILKRIMDNYEKGDEESVRLAQQELAAYRKDTKLIEEEKARINAEKNKHQKEERIREIDQEIARLQKEREHLAKE